MTPQRGFSLMEVMVALVILAVALTALLSAAGVQTSAVGHLRDRTLATWVGRNAMAEIRLFPEQHPGGAVEGESAMAGEDWRWRAEIQSTSDPDVERVELRVFLKSETAGESQGEGSLARLQGYRWNPQQ